jgi:hypothetical protein
MTPGWLTANVSGVKDDCQGTDPLTVTHLRPVDISARLAAVRTRMARDLSESLQHNAVPVDPR